MDRCNGYPDLGMCNRKEFERLLELERFAPLSRLANIRLARETRCVFIATSNAEASPRQWG
jgi:hypothetical protein